ncbi:hypothetical protein J6590_107430 [Homalodisca vitripennis]|nr:hypothetical protein J6590_107430 [Homalodisca vitripennis]
MPVLCGTKRAGPDRQACYRRPGALQPVKTGAGRRVPIPVKSVCQWCSCCGVLLCKVAIMFDTDKFIECVHGIPALWDKSGAEYSDKNIRDRAWIEIGIAMYEDWNCATLNERDDRGKSLYVVVVV